MNNRMSILVICLGVATVAVATLVFRAWPELGRQRAANAALLERVQALESQARRPALPPQAAASSAAAAGVPANDAPAGPDQAAPKAASPMAAVLQAMQSPFMSSMMRSAMEEAYPDIAEELDLDAAQVDRLLDMLVKQQMELAGDSMGLLTGAVKDPAAIQEAERRFTEKERAHEQELAALLGGKQAQWEEYQRLADARQQVSALRQALDAGGRPLSEAQEKSLVAAFAREQARTKQAARERMASPSVPGSPNMMQAELQRALDDQRRLVEVAAPILDAAQLGHYRRQVEQQASMMGAMMGMMGAQGDTP